MRMRQDAPQDQPAPRPGAATHAVEFGTGRPVPLSRQGTVTTTVRRVVTANPITRRPGG